MKAFGYMAAAIVGALVGAFVARPTVEDTQSGSMHPRVVPLLASIDARLASLVNRADRPSPDVSPSRSDEGGRTADDPTRANDEFAGNGRNAQIGSLVDDVVQDLVAIRDAMRALKHEVESPRVSMHELVTRLATPRWEAVDAFTKGWTENRQWGSQALRQLLMMTKGEVLEKFGVPTTSEPNRWAWERMPRDTTPGSARVLEITFHEGTVHYVKATDE